MLLVAPSGVGFALPSVNQSGSVPFDEPGAAG